MLVISYTRYSNRMRNGFFNGQAAGFGGKMTIFSKGKLTFVCPLELGYTRGTHHFQRNPQSHSCLFSSTLPRLLPMSQNPSHHRSNSIEMSFLMACVFSEFLSSCPPPQGQKSSMNPVFLAGTITIHLLFLLCPFAQAEVCGLLRCSLRGRKGNLPYPGKTEGLGIANFTQFAEDDSVFSQCENH